MPSKKHFGVFLPVLSFALVTRLLILVSKATYSSQISLSSNMYHSDMDLGNILGISWNRSHPWSILWIWCNNVTSLTCYWTSSGQWTQILSQRCTAIHFSDADPVWFRRLQQLNLLDSMPLLPPTASIQMFRTIFHLPLKYSIIYMFHMAFINIIMHYIRQFPKTLLSI